ncbi:hypothetical protein ANANG_G00151760 [Anguilla anguilla]|uniref:Uncharacterized protein n=1 Tax=Anguilla anguilla TaxID=7936 RepID=A0A9D3M8K2_ANGAN|nr:hypothetical protein ANANG_G00151760 [Anguilla anguilla]
MRVAIIIIYFFFTVGTGNFSQTFFVYSLLETVASDICLLLILVRCMLSVLTLRPVTSVYWELWLNSLLSLFMMETVTNFGSQASRQC